MDAEVFTFLLRQVEEAKRAYEEAKRRFWEIAVQPHEWPDHANPQDNGSELFRKVVAHEKFTLRAYVEAMTRLNQFLLNGTIPEELQEKAAESQSG